MRTQYPCKIINRIFHLLSIKIKKLINKYKYHTVSYNKMGQKKSKQIINETTKINTTNSDTYNTQPKTQPNTPYWIEKPYPMIRQPDGSICQHSGLVLVQNPEYKN